VSTDSFFRDLLAKADITLNGNKPWDLQVRDDRAFARVLRDGSVGFGEAFMEGWFGCERVDELAYRAYQAKLFDQIEVKQALIETLKVRLNPFGSRTRSHEVGEFHYDTGNDLFELMLDPYMQYSCGYWKRATTLEQAQRDKLELICRKLDLKPGQRLLDIGCGWTGLGRYAAKHFGVQVVGITVSKEQAEYGRERNSGLPIEIRVVDYRELDEQFDRIVSVGMFEHVGRRYYPDYFAAAERCLKPGGLFLLHTVGYQMEEAINPWYDKYIMPGVEFPTVANVANSAGTTLTHENLQVWDGSHYDRTLMAWWDRFHATWDRLKGRKYDERFYRMWQLYLQGCAGAFRADRMRVWQFVFSKGRRDGGYAYGHNFPID
jgi:cyclopropane-fatty-acyl-phospholipid synthase